MGKIEDLVEGFHAQIVEDIWLFESGLRKTFKLKEDPLKIISSIEEGLKRFDL